MFQGTEDIHVEVGKQPTPSSTFKPLVETISEDRIVVNSNLEEADVNSPEDGEDLDKTTSGPAQDSHDEGVKNDQQPTDGCNEEVSSPIENDKDKLPPESNYGDGSEHIETDGNILQEVVAEFETES